MTTATEIARTLGPCRIEAFRPDTWVKGSCESEIVFAELTYELEAGI